VGRGKRFSMSFSEEEFLNLHAVLGQLTGDDSEKTFGVYCRVNNALIKHRAATKRASDNEDVDD
jgi:hypothetical protein